MARNSVDAIFAPAQEWRRIKIEIAEDVAVEIDEIFRARGATEEQQRSFYTLALRRLLDSMERPRRSGPAKEARDAGE
jgi:hypothetical protein